MPSRRVVVTGIGVVAPNGTGIEDFWDSLVQGRSAVKTITRFDASSYPCQMAAEIRDFDAAAFMEPATAKRTARFAQFALASSKMAVEDSEVDLRSLDPYKVGVVIGTGIGGADHIETQYSIFMEKGIKRLSPRGAMVICTHSAVGAISHDLGLKGPNTTIAAACNSGLDAIYSAYNAIRMDDADMMVAGAGEAPITPCNLGLFSVGGILSRHNKEPEAALRPFDIDGDGIVLGEGGAALVLEELDSALKRKAKIYGEILGYASGNECYDLFEKDPSGDAGSFVMEKALKKAGLHARDVDYINAHGNAQEDFDLHETAAVKKAFGELAYSIPVTSIKPITGQCFALTGVLQTITSLLVIKRGVIPPTMNHRTPRPNCDLDYVPHEPRSADVKVALVNAMGFGGSDTVVILRKFGNSVRPN